MPALVVGRDGVAVGEQVCGERSVSAAVFAETMNEDDFASRIKRLMATHIQSQAIACRDGLFDERHSRFSLSPEDNSPECRQISLSRDEMQPTAPKNNPPCRQSTFPDAA